MAEFWIEVKELDGGYVAIIHELIVHNQIAGDAYIYDVRFTTRSDMRRELEGIARLRSPLVRQQVLTLRSGIFAIKSCICFLMKVLRPNFLLFRTPRWRPLRKAGPPPSGIELTSHILLVNQRSQQQ